MVKAILTAVMVTALTACGSGSTPAPPALPGAATTDVTAAPSGDMAHLTEVRLTPGDGYDRLELRFADRVPGYAIGYRPLPAHADGSGFEIPLPGAAALVEITLNPATGEGWGGGPPTYLGPPAVSAGTTSVTEAKAAGDFEAVLTWVAGLRTAVPFRVEVLGSPPRLVVDFAH